MVRRFEDLVQECEQLGLPEGYARVVDVTHMLRAMYFLLEEDDARSAGTAAHVKELLSSPRSYDGGWQERLQR